MREGVKVKVSNSEIYNIKIGIVGCGNLGRAILQSMLNHGFKKENLLISCKGKKETYEEVARIGAKSCLVSNEKIFDEAQVVFAAVKPQDMLLLKRMNCSKDNLVISCAAGVPLKTLKEIFSSNVCRIMTSGPETIIKNTGIAAIYPYNEIVLSILKEMDFGVFQAKGDDEINIFTTGVCLPAALIQVRSNEQIAAAVKKIGDEYPLFLDVYTWAKANVPAFNTESDKAEYIAKMVTKGGITEAIMENLKAGKSLTDALRKGILRSREISEAIGKIKG